MSSKEYFDNVANQWDAMRGDFFSERVREKAFEVAGIKKGEIAADLGAGTGFITEGLLNMGMKVIAVDQSQLMLDTMKNKFGQHSDITYVLGDAQQLPLKEDTVDYAFANMYLHHAENPPEAIKEMARITKTNGKVVITDLDEHDYEFLQKEQKDRWMGFKRAQVMRWFAEAGLKNVSIDCVGQNCCTKSTCGEESAAISIFIAYGEKQ